MLIHSFSLSRTYLMSPMFSSLIRLHSSSACNATADHNVTMFSKPFFFRLTELSNGSAVGTT